PDERDVLVYLPGCFWKITLEKHSHHLGVEIGAGLPPTTRFIIPTLVCLVYCRSHSLVLLLWCYHSDFRCSHDSTPYFFVGTTNESFCIIAQFSSYRRYPILSRTRSQSCMAIPQFFSSE